MVAYTDPRLSTTAVFSVSTSRRLDPVTVEENITGESGLYSTYESVTGTQTLVDVSALTNTLTLLLPTGTEPTRVVSQTISRISATGPPVFYTSTYPADFLTESSSSNSATTTASSSASSSTNTSPSAAAASPSASTPESAPPASQPPPHNGLSGGAIAGIVVGCIVALIIAILLILYFTRTRKRIRELSRLSTQPDSTAFEKAELPSSEPTWWERLLGRGKTGGDGEVAEMPAADETGMRAELEGTLVEPKELEVRDVTIVKGPEGAP